MTLIDAGHSYHQVISDINATFNFNCEPDSYIVFDDYGMEQYRLDVKKAVNEAININALTIVKKIGHESGFNFGGRPPRILSDSEGIITKINFNN